MVTTDYTRFINRNSFEEPTHTLEVIDTLISRLYLTDDFVYKTKKPVDLGFCDYQKISSRKLFCLGELSKNSLLSPDLYVHVLPVTEKHGTVLFGSNTGNIVDYALKMVRLEEKDKLSIVLKRKKVGRKFFVALGKQLAHFHQVLKAEKTGRFGGYRSVKKFWQQNFDQTEKFVGVFISSPDYKRLKESVHLFLDNNRSLFDNRVKKGRIRDGHGDLHTGNIFVGRKGSRTFPVIFDAIEFNKELSCLDCAADIAFLSMDLKYLGRCDMAKILIASYLKETADYEIVSSGLLRFYEAYRAFIRGKVALMRSDSFNLSVKERGKLVKEAKNYFKLSARIIYNE
ncbi:MAG: hypothetical protein AAB486_02320 [Patescibacteria group bacterium]